MSRGPHLGADDAKVDVAIRKATDVVNVVRSVLVLVLVMVFPFAERGDRLSVASTPEVGGTALGDGRSCFQWGCRARPMDPR